MLPASHRGRLVGRMFKDQSGYSLPEVMVAILILAIAIIPMVGMFDAGLRAATLGGNYDKARALANEKMEGVKALPFNTPPNPPADSAVEIYSPGTPVTGTVDQFSYRIATTYLDDTYSTSATPTTRMRVEVSVTWGSGNSYTTTGLITAGSR